MSRIYKKLIEEGGLLGRLVPCEFRDGTLVPLTYQDRDITPRDDGAYYYPDETEYAFDIDAKIMDDEGNLLDEIHDSDTGKFIMTKEKFLKECPEIWELLRPGGTYGNNTPKGHHIICPNEGVDMKKNKVYYKGIPFHTRGKAKGAGCGLYVDGSKKDGVNVTHKAFPDMASRTKKPMDGNMLLQLSRLSHARKKGRGSKGAGETSGKVDLSLSVDGKKIPDGCIRDALRDLACKLIGQGIMQDEVEDIVRQFNKRKSEYALEEGRLQSQIFDTLPGFIKDNNINTPYILVRNPLNMGNPAIIWECMKTLGYEYRKNIRKEGLDFRNDGDEEWTTNDISDVRDWHTVDAQNLTRHSLSIFPKFSGQNNRFREIVVKTKAFAFSEVDIKRAFKAIMRDNAFDPLMQWIDKHYPDYEAELRKSYEKLGREGVVREWECFNAHLDILGFKKTGDVRDMKFVETDKDYNQWLLYNIIAPAMHNTIASEPKEFPVVVMIGPNGCFKSSLPKVLLPHHLRADHFKKARFNMNNDDLGRLFATAIFVEFPELVGFHVDADRTKMIMSEVKDNWTKKFKEGCEISFRQCSWMGSSNNPQPLSYSPDNQRRYYAVYMYRNPAVTERGIREDKHTGDYVDYLEEWADAHRTKIWMQIYFLVKEASWGLGLPSNALEQKRIEYVKQACGYNDFHEQVQQAFQYYLEKDHVAVNYEMIYRLCDLKGAKRSSKRDDTVKQVYQELGGKKELERGWHHIKSDDDTTEKKNGRYFDLRLLREKNDTLLEGDEMETSSVSDMDREDMEGMEDGDDFANREAVFLERMARDMRRCKERVLILRASRAAKESQTKSSTLQ